MVEIEYRILKGNVIHDFPYPREGRKCPHTALISVTHSGSCIHNCPMCYAKAYPWSEEKIIIYKNVPQKLREELEKIDIAPPFYLSQVSDVLQPLKEVREITKEIVKILMEYGVSFRIVTKNAEGAEWLIEEVPQLKNYPYWYIEFSVETVPSKQIVTSPNASKIEERLRVMRKLHNMGIEVIGRVDPIIYGLTEISEAEWLIKKMAEIGIKHVITSTCYFNSDSLYRFIEHLEKTPFRHRKFTILKYYKPCEKGRYMLPRRLREEIHTHLRNYTESLGLTYSVCQELPREFDSKNIRHCGGAERSYVFVKNEKGEFVKIDCTADCINCPYPDEPPCGKKELQIEYPYKFKTLIKEKSLKIF